MICIGHFSAIILMRPDDITFSPDVLFFPAVAEPLQGAEVIIHRFLMLPGQRSPMVSQTNSNQGENIRKWRIHDHRDIPSSFGS